MVDVKKIKKDLKRNLSHDRYCHSIRVAEESLALAKVYGCDLENAYLAGLVHDIAKEFNEEENLYWIKKYNLSEKLLDSKFKKIRHALIGSIVVKELYGLSEDIAQAVSYHTVGNLKMNLLDKIVFVADKIESGKKYPGIEEERILAYLDINKALIMCLSNQRRKLKREGKVFHFDSLKLLDFLICQTNKEESSRD